MTIQEHISQMIDDLPEAELPPILMDELLQAIGTFHNSVRAVYEKSLAISDTHKVIDLKNLNLQQLVELNKLPKLKPF